VPPTELPRILLVGSGERDMTDPPLAKHVNASKFRWDTGNRAIRVPISSESWSESTLARQCYPMARGRDAAAHR
jgi:hypothetical protein